MIDCLSYSIMLIEASGMLLPQCSIRWGCSNDRHGKSNTPHAHYECTQYQNIRLADSYWEAADDPHVTNRTRLHRVKVLLFNQLHKIYKNKWELHQNIKHHMDRSEKVEDFCSKPPQRDRPTESHFAGRIRRALAEAPRGRLSFETMPCWHDAGRDASR